MIKGINIQMFGYVIFINKFRVYKHSLSELAKCTEFEKLTSSLHNGIYCMVTFFEELKFQGMRIFPLIYFVDRFSRVGLAYL